jgi:hypothetical protein
MKNRNERDRSGGESGAMPSAGARASWTARERIDAARGAGGTITAWPDGAGFDVDLRLVADALTRDMLLGLMHGHDSEILAELQREKGRP